MSVDLPTLNKYKYKYNTIQYKRKLGRARQAQSSNDSMTASGQCQHRRHLELAFTLREYVYRFFFFFCDFHDFVHLPRILHNFEFLPTCYSDTPILGNFEFSPTLRYSDKPILRNFEFYQHYVIAINRYYAILSVFAKNTLYRYNIKTDIT